MIWRSPEEDKERAANAIPARGEIERKDKWDVEAMYADDAAWESDFEKIDSLVAPIESMRGKLDTAAAVFELFEAQTRLHRLMRMLGVYASLRSDEDTAENANQARKARARAKGTEVAGRLAWVTPEILSRDEDTLKEWLDSPELAEDRHPFLRLVRRKPHTLTDGEETLLSRAGQIFAAPQQTFSMLTNADMRFPAIKDGAGEERELSQGRYTTFLLDRDRGVRRRAFEAMHDTYGSFRNTLASTLSANVKLDNYLAQSRKFGSALEASLFPDQAPVALYEGLISTVHDALPHFHRYMDLRKRQLGLDDIGMHDMHVPIVPDYEISVPYEQACEWVVEACEPLGEEYIEILRSAFAGRWVDVYENRGKRSGAYSSGCYDSLPYILMNYQGTLDSVFTLAHELGHSMHSRLARKAQPPRKASYPIFVAEIPSTLNEALLLRHLLKTNEDPRFRAYLLNHLCDSYKGTVFRQTIFAEFEKMVHEMDAEGRPLTPDALNEAYFGLNAAYFGSGVAADKRIGAEWSRIPHFYYNFYVYKYATSFCASQIFLERVLDDRRQRDQYLDLLRAGGSDDPLALIERAGVSLLDRETLTGALDRFGRTVDELGAVLGEL